jgi:hypothetical protein
MKYVLPLVLLAAAAWATQSDPHGTFARALAESRQPLRAPPEVPWLNEALAGAFAEAGVVASEDPHAALHEDADPHAGLYLEEDPHAELGKAAPGVVVPAGGVARSTAQNGHTIAELHARRAALAEQRVRVRGVVTKRTDGILGETYLHLQDGSGNPERDDHDLTLTTSQEIALGATVEVEGQLQIDRDLGLGYRYAVLLTGATLASAR